MRPAVAGAVLGAVVAVGLLLTILRVQAVRRMPLQDRVLPYLRDLLPDHGVVGTDGADVGGAGPADLLRRLLTRAAAGADAVLGGGDSVRRRLRRAGSPMSLHEFRVQQVVWGAAGFAVAAAYGLVSSWLRPTSPMALALACLGCFLGGMLLRDQRLGAQATARDAVIVAEFPALAELLALSVAAGEGVVAALERVVGRGGGALSVDLAAVLARIRTGQPVAEAFDAWAAESGVAVVARFAHAVAVAVERGTPLADVLHAQAADVREAGRRDLIEQAARKEIFMMIPVVFLILPVTVVFAFWPGFIGLTLTY